MTTVLFKFFLNFSFLICMFQSAHAVNVKNYGAKGDGVTDDTKAIQNAINASNLVEFPSGTFVVNPAIGLVLRSHVTIRGEGRNVSLILAKTGAGSIIKRNFSTSSSNSIVTNVLIEQIGIVLQHSYRPNLNGDPLQIGIDLRHVSSSVVDDCLITSVPPSGTLASIHHAGYASTSYAYRGYGIALGSFSSSSVAYVSASGNKISRNSLHNLRKGIVVDPTEFGPSHAHQTSIVNNDISFVEKGIAFEQRYNDKSRIQYNTLQSFIRSPLSTSSDYAVAYEIQCKNLYLGGGYIESAPGSLQYLVLLGANSQVNVVRPFLTGGFSNLIIDRGLNNNVLQP